MLLQVVHVLCWVHIASSLVLAPFANFSGQAVRSKIYLHCKRSTRKQVRVRRLNSRVGRETGIFLGPGLGSRENFGQLKAIETTAWENTPLGQRGKKVNIEF